MVKAALSTLAPNRPESKNCCFVKVLDSSFLEALVLHTIKTKIQVPLGPLLYIKIQNHRKEGCQMEKIKIHDTEYEIISIMPAATNVLQVEFADAVPEKWGRHYHIYSWRDGSRLH